MNCPSVCVIGLGFVGLTLATKLSEKRRVYGLDTNFSIVDSISKGIPHFHEEGLSGALEEAVNTGRFSAHQELSEIPVVDVYVITVGTPILSGEVNLTVFEKVVSELSQRVRPKDLVIVRSTVKVGSTRKAFFDAYKDRSNQEFPMVAMCPERTIEGSALRELVELPQIVSGINNKAVQAAGEFFMSFGCEVVPVSSLEAAEFAKLMNNTFRDVQFAFANEMAVAAEALKLDVREVIAAANKNYERSNVAMPGVTGGPCLEKDPWILVESVEKAGAFAHITQKARELHESLPEIAVTRIMSFLRLSKDLNPEDVENVAVLGLAFKGKPATDDVRGSLAKKLIIELRKSFPRASILGVDLEVSREDALALGVDDFVSTRAALERSSVAVIHNNHQQLQEEIQEICRTYRNDEIVVYDFWGVIDKDKISKSVDLMYFGDGTA